jgi:hypothetical protein
MYGISFKPSSYVLKWCKLTVNLFIKVTISTFTVWNTTPIIMIMKFQHLRTIPESDTSPQLLMLVHIIKVYHKHFLLHNFRILGILGMECKYIRTVWILKTKSGSLWSSRWKQNISLLLVFEHLFFLITCLGILMCCSSYIMYVHKMHSRNEHFVHFISYSTQSLELSSKLRRC